MNNQERIMEVVKILKSEGKQFCTRNDILKRIASKSMINATVFNELERNNKLIKIPCKAKFIMYSLEDNNKVQEATQRTKFIIDDIELIKENNEILIKVRDALNKANIPKEIGYRYTYKVDKRNKRYAGAEGYLLLNVQGFRDLCTQIAIDSSITSDQLHKILKIRDIIVNEEKENNSISVTKSDYKNTTEDTYEDLDEIFDSLLKTVDTISTRVNNFKNVKDDRDKQIRILESDKTFYKGKCEEYKRNVVRLQEKIDALRWG